MQVLMQSLLVVFGWLIRSSFEATVLLGLILLIRLAMRRRVHFRLIYWLWILLLVRLVWPLNLETTFSVFNWLPRPMEASAPVAAQTADTTFETQDAVVPHFIEPAEPVASASEPFVAEPATLPDETAAVSIRVVDALSLGWLAGAAALGGWVLWSNFRLWRIVKRERLVTRQAILDLLEDCKRQLGLQTVIGVVETPKVRTPCLFGYLRPRLLLPAGILDAMQASELRYVFLHELSHLKRHDILVGWLMAIVQVLHWFNPAVWFAMAQIGRDRELACDETALASLQDHESKAYGTTILAFLQRFTQQQKLPAMAGIAENQSLLKRRITMIAHFKNRKMSGMAAAMTMMTVGLLAATTFTAAQSAQPEPTFANEPSRPAAQDAAPARPEILAADDGKSAGRSSIAGGGHAVWFEPGKPVELAAVRIYGSRYGTPQPPDENFYVWIADENQDVLATFEFPYATIKRGNPKWYMLRTEPTRLPEQFYVCVGFNPERTKGVYVHHDAEADGHSYVGLPHDNYPFEKYADGDWMIRAVVRPADETAKTSSPGQEIIYTVKAGDTLSKIAENELGDSARSNEILSMNPGMNESDIKVGMKLKMPRMSPSVEKSWTPIPMPFMLPPGDSARLQELIDGVKPGEEILLPAGTYEEPIKITKSIKLFGSRDGETVFKVTANEPAIFIDTAGQNVALRDITIQWQLASSDQHEMPFAVAVKDTNAEITNCVFRPLGNPQRSPVAIRSMGFSKMDLTGCDFTGFDYVVCYGEGTKGRMQDCFIRNCGHQGVILYSGAEADIIRNIITGSAYHAVRTTGGKLNMADNLIVNNRNRGVYLGNKSGSGKITNNLFIGNASSIDGMSACRFVVTNNVILKSTYAAIAGRPNAALVIGGNVLANNERGVIIHQEEGKSDPVQSQLSQNVYWKNKTDVENIEKGDNAINEEPAFIDAADGNYKLTDQKFERIGLSDPETIYYLWKKYKEKL